MSASVMVRTNLGLIQFQKFHFFFLGQCPERFARVSGNRDQPIASGLRAPRSSHRRPVTFAPMEARPE